ncbi:trimethylguanosine synthase [Diutina catenulata]
MSSVAPEDELLLHNHTTLPKNVKRYWKKRYSLFSRFDEGVYMSSELWYSVTPEAVAKFIARLVYEVMYPESAAANDEVVRAPASVIDVCCGGGGNTIQFARYFDRVTAVDINSVNVTCTTHNCAIYGVGDRVQSVVGDWNELSDSIGSFDFAFCSPPWGGTHYTRAEDGFDLDKMVPFAVAGLIDSLLAVAPSCGLFLPRNSNYAQLEREAGRNPSRLVYLYLDNHCVGLLALYGAVCLRDWSYQPEFMEEGEEGEEEGDEGGDGLEY